MSGPWFLYLAPGYYNQGRLYDASDSGDRCSLSNLGAHSGFLELAAPGDVQEIERRTPRGAGRWLLRVGLVWDGEEDCEALFRERRRPAPPPTAPG